MGSNLIGSFQTRVNLNNPYGVEGDFASANPRATALTPDGGALVVGPLGVTIGKFAWIESDGRTVTNSGQSPAQPDGFVHRDQQGLLTEYLQSAGMLIPPGFPVTLMRAGDFLAKNAGPGSLSRSSSLYASYADGSVGSAAGTAGSVTATLGSTNTGSLGSTNTAALGSTSTGTAVVGNSDQITLSAVTGLISIGDTVSGVGITPGTTILAFISGSSGGAGVYQLSAENTAAAATITSFGVTVHVTVTTGLISIGDTISGGAGFPVGATVATQLAGGTPGGAGTYTLTAPGTAYTASATGVTTFGSVVKLTVVSTYVSIGDTITGGAGFPAAATTVTGFVSGTLGVAGVYTISHRGTAYTASATGVLTFGLTVSVTAIGAGTFAPGQPVADATNPTYVVANTVIESQISGTPGLTGVYTLSLPAISYSAGDNLTTTAGIALTNWTAVPLSGTSAAVGELVQITTWGN
jgi:hypothetical protein